MWVKDSPMLWTALEHILGTTAKVRLLRALIPLDTPASGREAERLAGIAHRSATRALHDLVALGVLRKTTTPGTHLYQINSDHDLVLPLKALFQAEAARFASLREAVNAALEATSLRKTVVSVVVFGSAARGDALPDSDLDLLALVQERSHMAAVGAFLPAVSALLGKRYGARPSVLVLPLLEARDRHENGDLLMQNIVAEGRTLFGSSIHEALGAR